MSLLTRVGITATVQGLGYSAFWTRVFQELGITMDHTFASSLAARDRKKNRKREYQKSKKSKLVKRKEYLLKFAQAHEEQMNNAKIGKHMGLASLSKNRKRVQKKDLPL